MYIHKHVFMHVQSLGQLGRVIVTEDDGYAVVKVNGRYWNFDGPCLVPALGEQPQDETSELHVYTCTCIYIYVTVHAKRDYKSVN